MSVLLQLRSGAKSFGVRQLFQNGQISVAAGEHIGVIGPNGAGKSTLFRILAGEQDLDAGEVVRAQRLRLAYLAQEDHFAPLETLTDYLQKSALLPLWDLKKIGLGLGLADDIWNQSLRALSGGMRMRCKLLALIGQDPNLLLLDEPTNYLDLESLLALENFLLDFKGAFLLISHDREFLRRTTDHILEIEAGEFTKFNGNIEDYFEQKMLLREQYEKQRLSQEAKRQAVVEFAARFGAKATKARQAQSRLKRLERMPTLAAKALPIHARIRIPEAERASKVLVKLSAAHLAYGDRAILEDVTLEIQRGLHVGVVGINGAGKSTLLKGLAGLLSPVVGSREVGQNVRIGYYAQHVAEALRPEQTVYEALAGAAHDGTATQEVKDLAGSLLFSADDMQKKIRLLSGGEKSRVALGQILLQKCSCLLLDEPTNHLDFDTVEALTQALENFGGALIAVSHDRSFLRRIASHIIEIRDRRARIYPGTYEEYVWSVQKGLFGQRGNEALEAQPPTSPTRSPTPGAAKVENYKEQRKALEKQLRQQEKELAQLTAQIELAQKQILDKTAELEGAHGMAAQNLGRELHDLQQQLDAKEEAWLEQAQRLELLQRDLSQLVGDGQKPR